MPENFEIILRGEVVEPHHIVNDLMYRECILYCPNVGGITEVDLFSIHFMFIVLLLTNVAGITEVDLFPVDLFSIHIMFIILLLTNVVNLLHLEIA
jgi:Morc6 ribosomal protein S5 domain 2-like